MVKSFLMNVVLKGFKLVLGKSLLIKVLYMYSNSTDTKVDDASVLLIDGLLNADKDKIEEGILQLFDLYINKGSPEAQGLPKE